MSYSLIHPGRCFELRHHADIDIQALGPLCHDGQEISIVCTCSVCKRKFGHRHFKDSDNVRCYLRDNNVVCKDCLEKLEPTARDYYANTKHAAITCKTALQSLRNISIDDVDFDESIKEDFELGIRSKSDIDIAKCHVIGYELYLGHAYVIEDCRIMYVDGCKSIVLLDTTCCMPESDDTMLTVQELSQHLEQYADLPMYFAYAFRGQYKVVAIDDIKLCENTNVADDNIVALYLFDNVCNTHPERTLQTVEQYEQGTLRTYLGHTKGKQLSIDDLQFIAYGKIPSSITDDRIRRIHQHIFDNLHKNVDL